MLDFKSCIKNKLVMDILANKTLNFAKVCLGVSLYDVQLQAIYMSIFLCNF